MSSGLIFDLSSRVKLRLTGEDRLRFLNGQCTNDVAKATESLAIEACILNAKGKLNGHVFISAGPDCFSLDADAAQRETLAQRLERYIIADDVQIEDVSEKLSILHVLNPIPPELDVPTRVISAQRFNNSGWDVWIDSALHDSVLKSLSAKFQVVDPDAAEVLRIEQGIPRWGRELTDEIIPVEANLESRTVDYEKGCYIGQEVISRMKISGQTNKRLCGLVSLKSEPFAMGMKLTKEAKDVGWITSATRSEDRQIALGYVKRGYNAAGTKLDGIAPEGAGAQPFAAEVVLLPFR
ncbi:MAG: YgfZ/GcvT domain-containing protein [Chthoniobacterales bacterium]